MYNPLSNEQASYRQWLRSLVKEEKLLLDSFRELHPDVSNAYTAWNTYLNSRPANQGCRIDYILLSPDLGPPILKSSSVLSDVHGSDHCPISCELLFPSDVVQSSTPLEYGPSLWTHHTAHKPLSHYFEKSSKRNSSKALLDSLASEFPSSTNSHGTPPSARSPSEKAKKKVKKQATLDTFFGLAAKEATSRTGPELTGKTLSECSSSLPIVNHQSFSDIKDFDSPTPTLDTQDHLKVWSDIFRPKPAPLCFHGEPAKSFTTKAKGPNTGRVFYACSKPGSTVNSMGQSSGATTKTVDKKAAVSLEERCKFFQWKNSSSSVKEAKFYG